VQDRVSEQVIQGLQLTLSPAEAKKLKPQEPIDPKAYEYYLRGVDLYSLNDFLAALTMLEKSTSIEPGYAQHGISGPCLCDQCIVAVRRTRELWQGTGGI
jgi:hypothetical protein